MKSSSTWPGAATSTLCSRRPSVGLAVRPALHDELVRTGLAIMAAVNEQLSFAHPEQQFIDTCHHVVFTEPGDESVSGRAAVAIHPGWLDRSPCGTGTSARMAQLYARGELALDQEYVHASVLGTTFRRTAARHDRRR